MSKQEDDVPLLADGFKEAILGMAYRASALAVVAYDFAKCVRVLVERDGMTEEEAEEFLEFNTLGAYVGEGTPVFIRLAAPADVLEELEEDV